MLKLKKLIQFNNMRHTYKSIKLLRQAEEWINQNIDKLYNNYTSITSETLA